MTFVDFAPGVTGLLDETSEAFPIESLARLPAGDYFVQALFDSNIDLEIGKRSGKSLQHPAQDSPRSISGRGGEDRAD